MTRRTIATIVILALSTFAANADAGCGGRQTGCHYRSHYNATRYAPVQHIRYVKPVVHHKIVTPVVHSAPAIAPPIESQYPIVPAGATITLPANFLGHAPGSVFMVFNNIKLPVQIHGWKATGVTVTLPPMAIKDNVVIRLDIVLPNGELAHKQMLRVTKPASVVLHPTAPTPQLPTQAALLGNPTGLIQ